MAGAHQKFGGSIVLSHYFLRHVAVAVRLLDSRQPEITDFEHTVTIDQKVARLDIPMEDASRVQVLQAAKDLVEENLDMICGQWLRRHDYFVEIALHQFRDDISDQEKGG